MPEYLSLPSLEPENPLLREKLRVEQHPTANLCRYWRRWVVLAGICGRSCLRRLHPLFWKDSSTECTFLTGLMNCQPTIAGLLSNRLLNCFRKIVLRVA